MEKSEPMTVGELQALLAGLPPEMRVLVDGYEGGQCDPRARVCMAALNVRPTPTWEGPHDVDKYCLEEADPASIVQVFLLSRQ